MTMIRKTVQDIRSIVQKNVGLLEQRLLIIALIAVRKLSLVSQLIKNTVTKNVGTSIIEQGSKDITLHNGKVVRPRRTNVSEHLQRLRSGVKRFINEITTLVRNVVGEVKKEIELSYTHIISNRYQNILNFPLKLVTGKHYVLNATGKQTLGATISDPKYVDVIRKRYAKFIGKEDEWEKVSPRI